MDRSATLASPPHAASHAADSGHHHQSFWTKYVFTQDHKMIGRQFLFFSLIMFMVGGLLALLVRWQLAYPARALTFMGKIAPAGMPDGVMLPEFYNMLFTMHATFMIFFAIMPLLIGAFGNFLIPLQIGARDMAFPLVNMLSFWVSVPAAVIMIAAFFVEGGAASAGWTGYAPLSAIQPGWGQTMWVISLLVLGTSSIMGALNYITTIVNLRAPGMSFMRMPLSIWGLFITAILLLLAVPVLTAALALLLLDRVGGTSFFLPAGLVISGEPLVRAGGGSPLLWQHLFWFFGHPEVYIMILPAMGIVSEIMSVFSRKPIFGYKAMVYSMCAIAGLGFIVWGHHMFQSGMNPTLGTSFMISTMFIAVPSAIKTFNWMGTLWGGAIRFTTPFLFAVSFVSTFVVGGLSGIFMAATPVDIFIHDTYFIVGHIHYVLFGGSMLGAFAAIYYWFPKMFGRMMNETLGKIHFVLTFITFNLTFFPMHILGMGGHMRRIYDPTQYTFLKDLQPINIFITMSAFTLGAVQIIFIWNFLWSLFKGKKAGENPWHANTLEWGTPSPPPHENFGEIPTVYRGPYEYSSPLVKEDWLPQTRKLEGVVEPAGGH